MKNVRHPTRRRLDEAETQLGKLLEYSIGDQIAKRRPRQDAIVREGVIALDIERLHQIAVPEADEEVRIGRSSFSAKA